MNTFVPYHRGMVMAMIQALWHPTVLELCFKTFVVSPIDQQMTVRKPWMIG
jgi:hypothetical protein